MGATTFTIIGRGSDFDTAFQDAYREAAWESGHSYSGTLSSVGSARAVTHTPLSEAAAYREADRRIAADEVDGKWGSASALPITDAPLRRRTRRARIVSDAVYEHDLARALADTIALKTGEMIESVEFDEPPTPAYTTTVRTTPGPAVVRYRLQGSFRGLIGTYATQAEARAAMVQALGEPAQMADTLSIEAVRVREDGSPLVMGIREPRRRTVRGTITIVTATPTAPVDRWLFFGWAPS